MYNVVLRILAYNSAAPMHVHAAALFSDILSVAAILLFLAIVQRLILSSLSLLPHFFPLLTLVTEFE